MAIQVNGCTVIDDDRNIVNAGDIRVGLVTITGSTGDIQTSGTITGAGYSVAGVGFTAFPGAGTTGVSPSSLASIILSFPTSVTRGTGTVELRSGTVNGSLVKSYNAATAPEITVLNNTWAVSVALTSVAASPTLPGFSTIFLVVPSTAITGFVGLNTTGADSYSFTTRGAGASLGASFEGGFLICTAGGNQWIVAPSSAQVARTWYLRNDANTRAQTVSGCTGWFVPTISQLSNPGYTCRTYWDSFSSAYYWSSTEVNADHACQMDFPSGAATLTAKPCPHCVRAFRCVTY